ncbi:hypothetical protein CFP56_012578 [Quercus suber]|uniref:Uncharacterized protein n=1 Tax=Quercus suber TaxID=58331 RepID=A0AAW0KXX4_QUESU
MELDSVCIRTQSNPEPQCHKPNLGQEPLLGQCVQLHDQKATTGDGLIPNRVPRKAKLAVAFGLIDTYRLIAFPSVSPIATAGRR